MLGFVAGGWQGSALAWPAGALGPPGPSAGWGGSVQLPAVSSARVSGVMEGALLPCL